LKNKEKQFGNGATIKNTTACQQPTSAIANFFGSGTFISLTSFCFNGK